MERREFLQGLVAAPVAAQPTEHGNWLDRISSRDMYECVKRATDAYPEAFRAIRREMNRYQQTQRRAARRAQRLAAGVNDTVSWRGAITEDLPRHSALREVLDRRKRAVMVATAKGGTWHGIDIAAGSRVLIDSRVPDDSVIGQRGEIIACADGRMRIHIWPSNRKHRAMTECPDCQAARPGDPDPIGCDTCGQPGREPIMDYADLYRDIGAAQSPVLPPAWEGE